MLHAHDSLRIIVPREPICLKDGLILQVWQGDIDRGRRRSLEPHLAAPGHVLDREECAVGDDFEIEVAVCDKDTVRGFDDAREDRLDGIGGEVAFVFGAAGADEDGAFALEPFDVRGGVHCLLDICAVEVN